MSKVSGKRKQFDYSGISDIDWARLAAYIDGEGAISIIESGRQRGNTFRDVRICIAQSDIRLMHWLQRMLGGFCGAPYKGLNKPCYNWNIGGFRAEEILRRTRKWMIVKGEQADIALAYRQTMGWHNRIQGVRGSPLKPEIVQLREELRIQMTALKPRKLGKGASRILVAPPTTVQ